MFASLIANSELAFPQFSTTLGRLGEGKFQRTVSLIAMFGTVAVIGSSSRLSEALEASTSSGWRSTPLATPQAA